MSWVVSVPSLVSRFVEVLDELHLVLTVVLLAYPQTIFFLSLISSIYFLTLAISLYSYHSCLYNPSIFFRYTTCVASKRTAFDVLADCRACLADLRSDWLRGRRSDASDMAGWVFYYWGRWVCDGVYIYCWLWVLFYWPCLFSTDKWCLLYFLLLLLFMLAWPLIDNLDLLLYLLSLGKIAPPLLFPLALPPFSALVILPSSCDICDIPPYIFCYNGRC